MDDHELLRAWQRGSSDAANQLFERYYPMLARYFRNKISTGAEDLIQQTFIACLEGRDRMGEGSSFRAYIYGTAHHILCAYYRRQRRDAPTDFSELSISDLSPGPSSLVVRRQEQRLLLEALRRIPLDHQALLELRYWENLSSVEIADILRVPSPSVRSRLRRARSLLEQALADLADSPEQLDSTLSNLDTWVADLRAQLGG